MPAQNTVQHPERMRSKEAAQAPSTQHSKKRSGILADAWQMACVAANVVGEQLLQAMQDGGQGKDARTAGPTQAAGSP